MKPRFTITRDYEPIPLSEGEVMAIVDPIFDLILSQLPESLQRIITPNLIRAAVEMAELPPVKNPVFGLNSLPDGTVLVIHDQSLLERTQRADLFDTRGHYLGSYDHPGLGLSGMVFTDTYAYAIENEDGDNILIRYRVHRP